MANKKDIQRIQVFRFSVPSEERAKLKFVSNIGVKAFAKSEEGFLDKSHIPISFFDELRMETERALYGNLGAGHYRRLNPGNFSISGQDLKIPLTHFYEFSPNYVGVFSYDPKTRLIYPLVKGEATALGYALKSVASRRKKKKERTFEEVMKDLGLDGIDLNGCGSPECLECILDEIEIEEMIEDSGEEFERAKYSTSGTRGEHPGAKFFERRRDKFKD